MCRMDWSTHVIYTPAGMFGSYIYIHTPELASLEQEHMHMTMYIACMVIVLLEHSSDNIIWICICIYFGPESELS